MYTFADGQLSFTAPASVIKSSAIASALLLPKLTSFKPTMINTLEGFNCATLSTSATAFVVVRLFPATTCALFKKPYS